MHVQPVLNVQQIIALELVQLIIPDEQPCFDLTQICDLDETVIYRSTRIYISAFCLTGGMCRI